MPSPSPPFSHSTTSIPVTYEAAEAYAVIRDGMQDYTDKFRLHTDFGTQHSH